MKLKSTRAPRPRRGCKRGGRGPNGSCRPETIQIANDLIGSDGITTDFDVEITSLVEDEIVILKIVKTILSPQRGRLPPTLFVAKCEMRNAQEYHFTEMRECRFLCAHDFEILNPNRKWQSLILNPDQNRYLRC